MYVSVFLRKQRLSMPQSTIICKSRHWPLYSFVVVIVSYILLFRQCCSFRLVVVYWASIQRYFLISQKRALSICTKTSRLCFSVQTFGLLRDALDRVHKKFRYFGELTFFLCSKNNVRCQAILNTFFLGGLIV